MDTQKLKVGDEVTLRDGQKGVVDQVIEGEDKTTVNYIVKWSGDDPTDNKAKIDYRMAVSGLELEDKEGVKLVTKSPLDAKKW